MRPDVLPSGAQHRLGGARRTVIDLSDDELARPATAGASTPVLVGALRSPEREAAAMDERVAAATSRAV